MLIRDYVADAMRTAKPMPDPAGDLEHAALGFITEIGELATEVKRTRIYLKTLDRVHLAEEIGDVLWYWALAANHLLLVNNATFSAVQSEVTEALQEGLTVDVHLSRLVRRLAANAGEFAALVEVEQHTEAAERLRDMLQCLVATCCVLGLDMAQCAHANVEKLRTRFPDKFTEAAAEARADKGGLDARVS